MREKADEVLLVRLGGGGRGKDAFLQPHHLEAARRLEGLVLRASIAPRTTMSYDPTRVGSGRAAGNTVAEASDGANQARHHLGRLAASLPADCWGVVFDVCALGKGLQVVEAERRWPRRSAKLVLRIALEQLAGVLGLTPVAQGAETGRSRAWLEGRLPLIADREG
jgi:hypothetical protein